MSSAAAAKRVLLVEDHEDSAEMLSVLLAAEGFEVIVASTMRAGMQKIGDCDLLVSDIGLPDGSGLELLAQVAAERHIPAIALSGYGSERDVLRSLEAGFSEHLTKPVDVDRLVAALRRLAS